MDPHNASYYFCNESYTKVFFVRDPLTRLVSGYLDKCTESIHRFWRDNYHFPCRDYLMSLGIDLETVTRYPPGVQRNKTDLNLFAIRILDRDRNTFGAFT